MITIGQKIENIHNTEVRHNREDNCRYQIQYDGWRSSGLYEGIKKSPYYDAFQNEHFDIDFYWDKYDHRPTFLFKLRKSKKRTAMLEEAQRNSW